MVDPVRPIARRDHLPRTDTIAPSRLNPSPSSDQPARAWRSLIQRRTPCWQRIAC